MCKSLQGANFTSTCTTATAPRSRLHPATLHHTHAQHGSVTAISPRHHGNRSRIVVPASAEPLTSICGISAKGNEAECSARANDPSARLRNVLSSIACGVPLGVMSADMSALSAPLRPICKARRAEGDVRMRADHMQLPR
jgi:hypothetical protein